jgi:hypothetical protein
MVVTPLAASARDVARFLFVQGIERFGRGFEPLDGNRRAAAVGQAIRTVGNFLQCAFDVAQSIVVRRGQIALEFECRQLLGIVLEFARAIIRFCIDGILLARFPAPHLENLLAQFGESALLPIEKSWIQS